MDGTEGTADRGDLAGLSLDAAVDAVVSGAADADREQVRATLERVAADGVVSREAAADALAHAAKVVATPETRTELAAIELEEAREAAAGVDDLPAVQSRLAAFEDRLAAVDERTEAVGGALQDAPDPTDGADLYEAARELRRVTDAATDAQRAADELQVDLEGFQRWLADPGIRYDDLETEVEELVDAVEGLADVAEKPAAPDEDVDAVRLDAALRQRALALLVADVRAELADLRAIDDRRGADPGGRPGDLAARLDDLDAELEAVREVLPGAERDPVRRFEAALADVDPPVNWGVVRDELAEARPGGGSELPPSDDSI